MKKKTRLLSLISTTLAGLALSLGVVGVSSKNSVETQAAIDINDYTSCNTAHSNNNASGLLTALRTITSPGSSGSYDQLWDTYKTAYLRADGKIFDYYSNITNFRPGTDQAGSYSGEGDVYNREHSIPKSWWGGSTSNQGADPYIVVPTDGWVNSMRSNYAMGPVGSVSKHSANNFSKLGTCASGWGNNGATVFEPDDSVKGDFARIIYYAIAKYSASSGWTSGDGSSVFSGSASTNFGLTNYAIKYCSAWSALDPVSDWERSVNDKVAAIQGNRNPFIDHPEYANTLWGSNSNYTVYPVESNKTLTSITLSNKTTSFEVGDSFIKPTVTAHFDDDSTSDVTDSATFSGYNMNSVGNYTVTASYTKGDVTKTATYSISVTASTKTLSSIAVSGQNTSFVVGDTFSFGGTVTATYSNSTQADVTESSTFTGYDLSQTGNQTVIVSYTFQGSTKTTTYTISVAEAPSEVTIAVSDIPGTYSSTSFTASGYSFGCSNIGNSYTSGNMQWKSGQGYMYNTTPISNIKTIKINSPTTGSFSGTIYTGSSSHPASGTSYPITGGQTVNITGNPSYFTIQAGSVSGGAKSGSIIIGTSPSSPKTLSSIAVSTAPTKTTYTAGEYFDPTGLVITRNYSDSTSDTYTYANHTSEFTFSPTTSTALTTSNTSVTITYGEKSTSQAITVNAAKTLSSISVSTAPTKTTYTTGETFDPTGLVIRRNYSDSTYDTYTYSGHTSEFTFSPSTSTALTTSNVSVTITYGGKSTTQAITVNAAAKTLSSISISGQKTSFTIDESFSFGGTVTANFSDSTSSNVTASATFTGYNMSVAGNYTVTVSYTYGGTTKTATYSITVNASGGGGGGEAEDFSTTYSYSDMSNWSVSNQGSASGYILCPNTSSSYSVALIPGIFTDKTITSNVVITINSATYGSGGSPTSTTYAVYNSEACTAQVAATQTGTLPSSSTYTDVIYTVALANTSSFSDDLAIKITKPGRQIRLKSIKVEFEYETAGSSEPITSITATPNKTFYVGETITSSDITVKGQSNQTVTDFSFTPHTFTYAEAASGGSLTNVLLSVSYEALNANFYAQVQRKAYASPTGSSSLEHTGSEFSTAGIGGSYATGQTATVDGITFSVDGYIYSSKLSLSSSKTSAPGKVINTTPYATGITNVTVSGASPDIQLSTDGSTWVNLGSAQTSTTNYYYLKLYYSNTSQSNYVNITSFTVTLKAGETAENVSNYIMYEDTANQCVSKLSTALDYYKNLTSSEKTTFQTSSDYVISTARTRLEAWATSQGKQINYSTGALTNKSNILSVINGKTVNNTTLLLVIIIAGFGSAIAGFYFYKKKEDR